MTDTKPLKPRLSYWIPYSKTGRAIVRDVGGVHCRTVKLLNHALGALDALVTLSCNGKSADNTRGRFSALETMKLGATTGTEVLIEAVGNDCEGAVFAAERALCRTFYHEPETDWPGLEPYVYVA